MRALDSLVDLLLVIFGFAAAYLIYNIFFEGGLTTYEVLSGSTVSVLAFWAAIELKNSRSSAPSSWWWIEFVERFCLGTGVNLLAHTVLTYTLHIRRTPFLIFTGGAFAAALLTLRTRASVERRHSQRRMLLIGFDSIAQRIFDRLPKNLLGVVTDNPEELPAGTSFLGYPGNMESILRQYRPTDIIVSMKDWARRISPSLLLEYSLSGVVVEESPAVYERLFNRVCAERLQPVDVLLSSALRGDSRTMAIQSVYTNLIAIALLFALSPLILLCTVAVAFFSGPGPIFETSECAGFQYIPFRLLRFRTTHIDGSGMLTRAGRMLNNFRLADLPQLVNVVRGDMALVGPCPVRSEFARYLTEAMPFHSHRFSVKPGILGWAQMHVISGQLADECHQIEYDLFYIKEGSLWLDVEIMVETVAQGGAQRPSRSSGASA